MIGSEIRDLQKASPFEPYTVHTSDGKALYVRHPDYLFVTPGDETLYIYGNETQREIVATRNVTRVVPGVRKLPRKTE